MIVLILLICSHILAIEGSVSGAIGPGVIDVTGDIYVPPNNVLEVRPGTVLRFDGYYGIVVDGIIRIEGTSSFPVILTSVNDSRYGGTNPNPLDWNCIEITPAAGECIFKSVEIAYGSDGIKSSGKRCCFEAVLLRFNGKNSVTHGDVPLNPDSDGLVNLRCEKSALKTAPLQESAIVAKDTNVIAKSRKNTRLYAALCIAAASAAAAGYYVYESGNGKQDVQPIPDPPNPPSRP